MILTNSGVLKLMQRIKSFITSQLNTKAASVHTHTKSDITDLPNGYVVDSTLDGTSSNAIANSAVSNALNGYIPRSGGAVITGNSLAKNVDNSFFEVKAGPNGGALVGVNGKDHPSSPGNAYILADNGNSNHIMIWYYYGTLTWNGQPIQYTSDQRLKQQITEIDDKLLDAWQDVNLVQFKYNDAVDQKGKDKARLHTGYVVQQIDTACKSHGVDVSAYGLYCHEEYPEETEEVEVEQKDGTKVKERKVIREASEHYSLRYTEVYAVECMYLRRENARLKQQMQQYTESLRKLEERLKALEQTSK